MTRNFSAYRPAESCLPRGCSKPISEESSAAHDDDHTQVHTPRERDAVIFSLYFSSAGSQSPGHSGQRSIAAAAAPGKTHLYMYIRIRHTHTILDRGRVWRLFASLTVRYDSTDARIYSGTIFQSYESI